MRAKMPLLRHFLFISLSVFSLWAQDETGGPQQAPQADTALPDESMRTAEDFLERARGHFERRRFLNTLDSLRVALEMTAAEDARNNPVKREAEILAAQSLAALGRKEEAANMYERAIAHGFSETRAFAFLGSYFEGRGQLSKAEDYYARYFAADKSDAESHVRYAIVLGRLGRREDARQVLAAIEPAAAVKKAEECELLERKKKLREALGCFLLYRNSHPDREQGYLSLYRLHRQTGNLPAQLQYAQALYFLFGNESRYIWPLVEVRIAQRRFYDARLLLEEVVKMKGKDADAEKLLANLKREAPEAVKKPFRATPAEMYLLESLEK